MASATFEEEGQDLAKVILDNSTSLVEDEDSLSKAEPEDAGSKLPDYVCCVVTEGVWTYFAAALLIVVLFAVATLKYCKKYLAKPRFHQKGQRLHLRSVLYDDRGAISSVREGAVRVGGGEYLRYCAARRRHKRVDAVEFRRAVEGARRDSVVAAHRHGKLNQSKWSVPFEKNRVTLDVAPGVTAANDESSGAHSYINASRLSDYRGGPLCVVTQGPLENTVADFWRLVWQEGFSQVVMLTRTFEFIKIMCVQYWPPHLKKPETYGEFTVVVNEEECYAQYRIRSMTVKKGDEIREVTHYHYHGWHAYTTPPPNMILQFRRRLVEDHRRANPEEEEDRSSPSPEKEEEEGDEVKEEQSCEEERDVEKGSPEPKEEEETAGMTTPAPGRKRLSWPLPLVHCSDGGARSGMFAALLDCLARAEEEGEVDVLGTMRRMLSERRSLFSSPTHLRFVYDVIEDEVLCGDTSVRANELLPRLQAKSQRLEGGADKDSEYEREHRLLNSLLPRFTIGDCAAGHRAENRAKNRNVLVVPPDNNRPYLTSTVGISGATDYVNAVFVDGYRREEEFVVTEWPTAHTLPSFWSLVNDFDLRTVVVLNHHQHHTDGMPMSALAESLSSFPAFWPQGGPTGGPTKVNYGQVFCVEQKSCSNYGGKFTAWELMLMKQDISPKKFSSRADVKHQDLTSLSTLLNSLKAPPKPINLFQIHCWPNNQKVPNSTMALVHLIKEVDSWRSSSAGGDGDLGRVLVVSDDGFSRCGIYCAAAACLDQVQSHGSVDVFQAVKSIRKSRPQLVANPTEYKYCYDVVLHYVLNFCEGGGEEGTDPTSVRRGRSEARCYELVGEEEK